MNARERRQQLNAALQAVLEDQGDAVTSRARKGKVRRRVSRKVLVTGLAAGWLLIVWIWVARPGFLFGTKAQAFDAAYREASLRYSLYLQRGRIDRHVAEFGSLPATLKATNQPVESDMIYVPSGSGYTLIGRDSTLELQLTSRMSVDSFLGSSLDVLRSKQPDTSDQ
jgi:hypothetical protein